MSFISKTLNILSPWGQLTFWGGGLPLLGLYLVNTFVPQQRWSYYPLHAGITELSALMAVLLAAMLIQSIRQQRLPNDYLWPALSFLTMGILDGVRGFLPVDYSTLWLHGMATTIGGLLFALVWLPKKLYCDCMLARLPKTMTLVSITLGVTATLQPGWIFRFSSIDHYLHTIGNVGFVAAWLFFAHRYRTTLCPQKTPAATQNTPFPLQSTTERLLANQCLLFGMTELLAEFATAWSPTWWVWHILQLLAYILALRLLLALHQQEMFVLRETQERLEHQVGSNVVLNQLLSTSLTPMPLPQQLLAMLDAIFTVSWFSLNQRGGIFLVDPATGELELHAQRGFAPELAACQRVAPGFCLCGRVAQTGQLLFASQVDEQHDMHYEGMTDHGHYCVPIKKGDHLLGVLTLYVQVGHPHKTEEDEFLQTVASTIAGLLERKRLEETIWQQAKLDSLTGIPNRTLFRDRLDHALDQAKRTKTEVVLMLLDLDHFKRVNDTMGHPAGDKLLQEATKRLLACVRSSDTVARLSGDEFAIILPKLTNLFYVEFVARRILEDLSTPFQLPEGEANVSCSIGITLFPQDATIVEHMLQSADAAMYSAKESGRSAFRFFEIEMHNKAMKRLDLERALKLALENDEFLLYYQPKVDPTSGCMVGMEALIRWQRPHVGMVAPNDFIPIAEQSGLIVPIGTLVLQMACQQNKAWIDAGYPPLCVSVNLSARQLQQGNDLVATVQKILTQTGLSPANLELEITESMMMENMTEALTVMHQLKALGVKISVDDFGTGYSSLSVLKNLPIQTLKIDRSFIIGVCDDPDSRAIVLAILSLAKQLHLRVIAEGVEQAAQATFLQQNGCDEIQGYYYSKPLPAAEFAPLINHLFPNATTLQQDIFQEQDASTLVQNS